MNNIPEKILELVSMFCTYFGIIFMVAAPLSFFTNISDRKTNGAILFLVCAGMFVVGYFLFKLRGIIEKKFNIYL